MYPQPHELSTAYVYDKKNGQFLDSRDHQPDTSHPQKLYPYRIARQVTIKNTGNTALDTVFLTDTVADAGSIDCDQDFAAANSEFLPDSHPSGDAIVCTVETLLTGSHIDAGGFKGTSKVGWCTNPVACGTW